MITISKNKSGNFDAMDNEQPIALNVELQTALSSCKHLLVTLQPAVVEFLLDELASLRQYEADEYDRQMDAWDRDQD